MPRVSVCMGVYNGSETLREALDSVVKQSFQDFEIVVVDDGSTDASADIAREFGARVVAQTNAGLGAVRKRLVEEATGDLIAFIDHDDTWTPNKLQVQLPHFQGSDVVLVHSDCWYLYENGEVVQRNLSQRLGQAFDHILPDNIIIASSALFSREAMLRAGNFIPETIRCSDWYGWFLLAHEGRFVHVPEKQVEYKVLSTSLANSGYKFQEAKRYLLRDIILPRFDVIFERASPHDRRRYRRMVMRNIGIAASTMAKYLDRQGQKEEARELHREAMRLAGTVPRVALRSVRSRLG